MNRNKTILLGNSVNLLTNNNKKSYEKLILNLCSKYSCDKHSLIYKDLNKPLPLLYEELLHTAIKCNHNKDVIKNIKADLIEELNQIGINDYHKQYMELGIKNIFTSNYDYNLEKSISGKPINENILRENKFSLFRRKKINNSYIWHIHGEINNENSLVLGYDNYVSYLSEMKKYLSSASVTHKERIRSPYNFKNFDRNFDKTDNKIKYSWTDLFFRDDVHIVGLKLDYSEIDLWWLIATKGYKKLINPQTKNRYGETIVHYFKENNNSNSDMAKISMLKSFGVDIREYNIKREDDYKFNHDKILKEIKI